MRQVGPVTLVDLQAALGPQVRLHLPAGAAPAAQARLDDVTHDSRRAGPGVLFAARPGAHVDGHDFAAAAAAAGSPALLVERPLDATVAQLVVADVAAALGPAAAFVHGAPSEQLALLGVTGTAGKTSTTFLVDALLRAGGHRTGLIGTVATRVGDDEVPGIRTTPEAPELTRLLARMVRAGVTAGAMEVSSHGLALGRVDGTRFSAAGFTNLSQDHLDFHPDLEAYEAAKRRLFQGGFAPLAVIDAGSPAGVRMASAARDAGLALTTVAVGGRAADGSPCDVRAEGLVERPDGTAFTIVAASGRHPARLRLPGRFNVANALLAWALAVHGAQVDPEVAAGALEDLAGVPGRMEPVAAGQAATVLVDYAHKPGALEGVLATTRAMARGRVVVVIGCGGDRDRGKRPAMGRIAAAGADLAVLTSDNPRSEDPRAILEAMRAGAEGAGAGEVVVEPDRRAAIARALDGAREGDVVLIAGKGDEVTQEVAGELLPFDDRAVVRELMGGGA